MCKQYSLPSFTSQQNALIIIRLSKTKRTFVAKIQSLEKWALQIKPIDINILLSIALMLKLAFVLQNWIHVNITNSFEPLYINKQIEIFENRLGKEESKRLVRVLKM